MAIARSAPETTRRHNATKKDALKVADFIGSEAGADCNGVAVAGVEVEKVTIAAAKQEGQ